jgi:hypothetical protein
MPAETARRLRALAEDYKMIECAHRNKSSRDKFLVPVRVLVVYVNN